MFKIRSILNDFVQQNIPSPFRMLGNPTITTLCALPKGAGTERIRTEMRQVIEEEGLSGSMKVSMDH
jgi:hypothetical protein